MRRACGERGQTTAEYVGLILIVAAAMAAVSASGIGEVVRAKVEEAIAGIITDGGVTQAERSTAKVIGNREVVFRSASRSGAPKVEITDHGTKFLEKITFLP